MSTDRHYLPPTEQHAVRWINTGGWTRVMIDVLGIDEFPENTFGRIIERRDYIMFEDARDAVMFKLGLK